MGQDDYFDSFSVCFNMMKMKYQSYDKDIDNAGFLSPTDKVNVFINFETVLKYLSQIKDVDRKMVLERELPVILSSGSLNLMAHYKRFFVQNGLTTRVFLYYTDLKSDSYQLQSINEDYRSYYEQKYLHNPKFSMIGDLMSDTVIPEIQTIAQFINGVYFIKASNFDGSLVPLIIANNDKEYKNLIISGDYYDTQYQFFSDRFLMHFMKRSSSGSDISYDINRSAKILFFDKPDDIDLSIITGNLSFYNILLAAKGSKHRCIDGIKGIGPKTIYKYIMSAISNGSIAEDTSSMDLIIDTFPEDIQEDMRINAYCTNIVDQYKKLTSEDLFSIEKQLVDRFDNNSLLRLNSDRYYHHQLMLQELTM